MKQKYLFILGTEAELIKMVSVLETFKRKRAPFKIISTGQNDIRNSTMLKYLKIEKLDKVLYEKKITQTPFWLTWWFISTLVRCALYLVSERRKTANQDVWVIVHGDTLTTMLGAIAGRIAGFKVAHVEAGYKSGNFFKPFPEEIDRYVGSLFSNVLFCPYDSIGFRPKTNKPTVNIGLNTAIDTLNIALSLPNNLRIKDKLKGKKYFVFGLHRQETLINPARVRKIIGNLLNLKTDFYCVFPMHTPTQKVLTDLGLYSKIVKLRKIILLERIPYFEYAHLLAKAEFLMSDGAGNQQEAYYLGKPYLILRTKVEGGEGLGKNAVLSSGTIGEMNDFAKNYPKYRHARIRPKVSPSKIICDYLLK